MFIEKSKYLSTTRVRIMEQELVDGHWKRKLICHIGTAKSDFDLKLLMERAKQTLDKLERPNQLRFPFPSEIQTSDLRTIGQFHQGADLILGHLFDLLGIEREKASLLRLLVIARILLPGSKRRTVQFLNQSFGTSLDLDQVYRYMDKIAKIQDEIFSSTRNYLMTTYPGSFGYILYDVTTLYFETDNEDEDNENPGLRKKGYSKDKRDDLSQVVLGLGVNSLGMPLSYRLYPGNTFEGSTLLDGIDETLNTMGLASLTVVGDAGMLSEKNLTALEARKLHYIVGARLKSLPKSLQDEITSLDFSRDSTHEIIYKNRRIVISYSASRAKRAISQRERSIARLEKLIAKNQAVRKHQYLDFTIKEKPTINIDAIAQASKWDGIKGYVTNNFELNQDEVITHYGELYRVEQSFRMSKSDLKIRPAFHYREKRIQAHVVICMLGLCVLRMLEYQVKPIGLTVRSALDEINATKAAIVKLGDRQFLIPAEYGPIIKQIIGTLKLNDQIVV